MAANEVPTNSSAIQQLYLYRSLEHSIMSHMIFTPVSHSQFGQSSLWIGNLLSISICTLQVYKKTNVFQSPEFNSFLLHFSVSVLSKYYMNWRSAPVTSLKKKKFGHSIILKLRTNPMSHWLFVAPPLKLRLPCIWRRRARLAAARWTKFEMAINWVYRNLLFADERLYMPCNMYPRAHWFCSSAILSFLLENGWKCWLILTSRWLTLFRVLRECFNSWKSLDHAGSAIKLKFGTDDYTRLKASTSSSELGFSSFQAWELSKVAKMLEYFQFDGSPKSIEVR